MATEHGQDDGRRVTSQDSYTEQVHERRWVDLEDGDASFKVQEVPPLSLLRDMEEYGVMEMLGGGDDDEVDMQEVLDEGDLNGFINDVVIPNILRPKVYWTDVSVLFQYVSDDFETRIHEEFWDNDEQDWAVAERRVADAVENAIDDPVWDLGALTTDDLMAVITGLTGRDADELQEQADNQFRGE